MRALTLGRFCVVLAAFAFLAFDESSSRFLPSDPPFANPPEIHSKNGVLHVTLMPRWSEFEVAGQRVRANAYNGSFLPPLLRVEPGDKVLIHLKNRSDEPSNLHTHGLRVSPLGNSDNIFNEVEPQTDFDIQIDVPEDHPPGLFWYHPHMHGLVQRQIASGQSGGMIVEGILDPLPPELRASKEQILLLKDIEIINGKVPDRISPLNPTHYTVNGLTNPTMTIQPGETQFWRIANIGYDRYYQLQLEGHTLYEIATDGNRHPRVIPRQILLLPPASRSEVFIQGGPPGTYRLKTLKFNTGPMGFEFPQTTLATLVSAGPAQTPFPLPTKLPPQDEDLRGKPIDVYRTVAFSVEEKPNGVRDFLINGAQFNMDRIDTTVKLGSIEQWTLRNISGELHTFHIHQLDFQVIEINGVKRPFVGRQDNVNIPVHGTVKVLIPFTDPKILGKFVFHCHIAFHEDHGMMAVIEVKDPRNLKAGSSEVRGIAMPPTSAAHFH